MSPTSDNRFGPVAGLEWDIGRRATPESTLLPTLGLRLTYEHFGSTPQVQGGAAVTRRDAASLSLLAMLRSGRADARLSFYGGVAPQLVVAYIREAGDRAYQHAWVAGALLAGAEVRLGPGRLLLEVDGRYPVRGSRMANNTRLGILQVLAGYRLGL